MTAKLQLPKHFFILAPMDDVTDTVFRQIIAETAKPDLFFTEFVNVDGLQSPGRPKLLPKLARVAKEGPVIAQIWGKNPENYYKTVKDLKKMGFVGVDINMGCPAKTVVRSGACSALIDNRELAAEIIKATQKAAGPDFPVSVKTRLGLGQVDMTWPEFLLGFNLDMLTIHGRTVKEMSKVPAHWDLIGEVRGLRDKHSPGTLIVGNGDVLTREQGLKLAKQHKLDGIMIGRGIFNDPYVFAAKSPWANFTPEQKLALYKKHIELFAKSPNPKPLPTLNKFCKIYVNGFDGAKELREKLMSATTVDQLLAGVASAPVGHLN